MRFTPAIILLAEGHVVAILDARDAPSGRQPICFGRTDALMFAWTPEVDPAGRQIYRHKPRIRTATILKFEKRPPAAGASHRAG